jgi:oligopeptide transport system ATP-binding protein
MALLSVQDLTIRFQTRQGGVRVADGVTFDLEAGETLGIVGESGSGKSVTCLSLLGLLPRPQAVLERGSAWFDGIDLLNAAPGILRGVRGRRISMVFQDPMTALNPFMRISDQLTEPLRLHFGMGRRAALENAVTALEQVGIAGAALRIHQYPHHFSGGMRQRVMIAMAVLTRPDLLIADEPTTALDVTSQAQILELIKRMKDELGTAVILVTHNLGVVANACDRVLVMYSGRILESGTTEEILLRPAHPYTAALKASMPAVQEGEGELRAIPGAPPAPGEMPKGCPFAPRCEFAAEKCRKELVKARPLQRSEHKTACIRVLHGDLPRAL